MNDTLLDVMRNVLKIHDDRSSHSEIFFETFLSSSSVSTNILYK